MSATSKKAQETKKHHKKTVSGKVAAPEKPKQMVKEDSKLYLDDMQDLKCSRLIFTDQEKNRRAMKPFMPRAKSTQHFRPDITGNRESDFRSQNALFIPALVNIEQQQKKKVSHRPRPQKE